MNWKEISEQRARERRVERKEAHKAMKVEECRLRKKGNAPEEAKAQEIERFILANYQLMTLTDMTDELGCEYGNVVRTCNRLGIKAISAKEQNKKYILEMYLLLSKDVIAKRLGIGREHLTTIYFALGIAEPQKFREPGETQIVTPRQVMSKFQIDAANHYQDIPDRVETMEDVLRGEKTIR